MRRSVRGGEGGQEGGGGRGRWQQGYEGGGGGWRGGKGEGEKKGKMRGGGLQMDMMEYLGGHRL